MFLRAKKLNQFIPEHVKTICSKFQEKSFDCYIVGGAIRDILLGKTPSEYDLATNALPEQVEALFEETIPTGKKFGTISVKLEGEIYEVTTFRKESGYSDNRHPDQIEFTDDIREDLKRRDFTINAIAFSPIKNDLVDSFHGLEDLHNRILQSVGNPNKRFNEDGLRVWRGMRFLSQLEFAIGIDTGKAMKKFAEDSLQLAAKERIIIELQKSLAGCNPDYGLSFIEGLPPLNKHKNRDVRLAALCQEKPQFKELLLKKETRKKVENLIKYDLDIEKANFTVKDLKITGIDIMEIGPRGEDIGIVLDKIKDIVLEFKRINKKDRLLKIAKEMVAGVAEETIKEKVRTGLYN